MKPRGRHPIQRLSAVSIRTKQKPGRYADGNGLYLVVDPSGARRWVWRGIIHGKRSDLGLGGTQLVTLADARQQALTCRRMARAGDNPKLVRAERKRIVPTFKDAARLVHAEHAKTFRNPKHAAQWLQSLENDVFDVIGQMPINAIKSGDVMKVLSPVWLEKPETARRLKQRMKVVFDWAKASGYREGLDNPTEGLTKILPKHKGDKEHHAALPYKDVPQFVTDLRALPDMQDSVRLGLELLILTATRTTETRLAVWQEVDLDQRVWTIPGERMKSGKEHRIPLCDRAVEILNDAARQKTSETSWIFPGSKPGQPLSNMTFLKASRRLTSTPLTTHGFRSSFRDWCEERTNAPRTVAEAALAHVVKDKTEAAYRRTDLFEKRRDLMDLWSRFVTSTPASVVSIGA